jgi:hypothetical protein
MFAILKVELYRKRLDSDEISSCDIDSIYACQNRQYLIVTRDAD